MNTAHIKIITGFELRRLFRSAHGWLFLSFLVIFYGWALTRLADIASELDKLGATVTAASQVAGGIISWWTDLSPTTLEAMFARHPAFLLVFFALSLGTTPLFAMIGALDQSASDIGNKHMRYLLMRTDRTSLYIGKTLGAWLGFALAMLVITVIVGATAVALGATKGHSGLDIFLYLGRIWLTNTFFALPLVTLLGFGGAATGIPFIALLIGVGWQFLVWMMSSVGSWANAAFANVGYLFPTKYKYHLMSDTLGDIGVAALHMSPFALALFALGLFIFRRRDV